MNKNYILIGLILLIVVVIIIKMAMNNDTSREVVSEETTTLPTEEVLIEEPLTLTSTNWAWQKTTLQNGEVVTAPEGEKFILTISGDGSVTSTTDCNNIRGTYTQNVEVISFSSFMATRMFCEGSQEGAYTEQLSLANSYTINGDTLVINLNRDYGVMTFSPAK